MFGDTVTLVNRTSRTLFVTFDGKEVPIKPGPNPGFPRVAVPYAKRQNPLMGSQHPNDPNSYVSLVGVGGTKDPITPIEQSKSIERIDRSRLNRIAKAAVELEGDPITPFGARIADAAAFIDGGAYLNQ